MAQQAQDTFVATLKDGTDRLVTKGEVLPDSHELVRRDQAGSASLFKPLDLGDDTPAPRNAPKTAPQTPVKPDAARSGKAVRGG